MNNISLEERLSAVALAEVQRITDALTSPNVRTDSIGRILRAHLIVEAALNEHLAAMVPNLGSIEEVNLNFDRLRVAVVGLRQGSAAFLNEPLIALNRLRNRLAHRLDAPLSLDDVRPISNVVASWLGPRRHVEPWRSVLLDVVHTVEAFAVATSMTLAVTRAALEKAATLEEEARAAERAAVALFHQLFEQPSAVESGT